LKEGDYLVCDNASVHTGGDMRPLLETLMDIKGIRLVYLPTYSPELNPCELVFSKVKNLLRSNRGGQRWWIEILKSLGNVSYLDVVNAYKHSLFIKE